MWHDVTWHDMTWHADVTWHDMLMWHDMTALICEEILFTNLLTNFIKNCRQSVNKLKTTWRNRVPWALLVLCSSSSLFSPTHKIWLKSYQRKLLTCPKTGKSEASGNGPKWFPIHKNLGVHTKIKSLACSEVELLHEELHRLLRPSALILTTLPLWSYFHGMCSEFI